MIAVSASARDSAIERAKHWLESLSPATREAKALRRLGLLCCKRLGLGLGLTGQRGGSRRLRLPAMGVFVAMNRQRMHALCRSISLASVRARQAAVARPEAWSEMFGGVALSYARLGDPSTTAVLLRASAHLGLKHPWLQQAESYLFDQQAPEGCFGLFSRELALVASGNAPWRPHLNLTVEVLWALAEVTALKAADELDNSQAHSSE